MCRQATGDVGMASWEPPQDVALRPPATRIAIASIPLSQPSIPASVHSGAAPCEIMHRG